MLCRRAKIKANCWYGRWVHGGLAVLLVMRVSLPSSSFPFPFFVVVVVVVSNDPRDFFFFFLVKCVIDTWARTHRCVGPVSWPAHIGPLSSSSQVVRSLVFSFVFFFFVVLFIYFFSFSWNDNRKKNMCGQFVRRASLPPAPPRRSTNVARLFPCGLITSQKKTKQKKVLIQCCLFCLFFLSFFRWCCCRLSKFLFVFISFFFFRDWPIR